MRPTLLLGLVTLAAACGGGVIVDNWGPPAGYAALQGRLQRSPGPPVSGIRVAVSRCAEPIGGFFAENASDSEGRYRVDGALPPVGALPGLAVETLVVRCDVFVGLPGSPVLTDTVTLRFAALRQSVVPTLRDYSVP